MSSPPSPKISTRDGGLAWSAATSCFRSAAPKGRYRPFSSLAIAFAFRYPVANVAIALTTKMKKICNERNALAGFACEARASLSGSRWRWSSQRRARCAVIRPSRPSYGGFVGRIVRSERGDEHDALCVVDAETQRHAARARRSDAARWSFSLPCLSGYCFGSVASDSNSAVSVGRKRGSSPTSSAAAATLRCSRSS